MCYQGIARRLKRCSTAVCDKCRPAAMRTLIYNTRMAVCAAALDCYSKMSLCEKSSVESLDGRLPARAERSLEQKSER